MKPTIGRIVHFVQKRIYGSPEQPLITLPAIITAIWSDTCVNLMVFTDGTNSDDSNTVNCKWITSSNLDESENPQERTWHWPPRS